MKRFLCALLLFVPLAVGAAEHIKHPNEQVDLTLIPDEKHQYPELLEWKHPVYPPELVAEGPHASVRIRYIVDKNGAITAPEVLEGDERFHAAALTAINQWRYRRPAENHELVPLSLEVEFNFNPKGPPESISQFEVPYEVNVSPHHHPEERNAPDPVYPRHLEKRLLFGEVELNLGINAQGRVDGVEVVRATHADFLSAAFAALEQWEFQPAMSGRLPEDGEQIAVLKFTVVDSETNRTAQKNWLEKNGITLRDPGAPKSSDYFDEIPQAMVVVDPVYPHDLLTKGVEGTAQVNFSVNKEGEISEVAIVEATEPDFGAALAAAIVAWHFKPLYHQGEKAWADFSILWKFTRPNEENTGPESLTALNSGINRAGAKELDRPLSPLYRRAPVYPPELFSAKTSGQADIEIIVNQSGRVCWPRIIRATDPAFGWAAATALSRWYFETPRKGGKPVDVRVVIPVKFKPEQGAGNPGGVG